MPELTLQQAYDLALQHHLAGRLADAESVYRQILAADPNQPETLHSLGVIAHQVGRHDVAVELIGKALSFRADWPTALCHLGVALHGHGQLDEAIVAQRRAIALKPDYPDALNNLGVALRDKGLLDDAIAAYRQAIALRPNYSEAYNNLGKAFLYQGDFEQAIVAYRQAIALAPQNSSYRSNYLCMLLYHPAADDASIADELRHWAQQHAEPLRSLIQPPTNDRTPERRLRIGYVSPDFREHPVGHFLLPLFAQHDREQYEIFAYAQVSSPDKITERLRAQTDVWRSTVGLSDEQVAEMIRADQIDILIDLAMHTANNRLLVFARKPAPVQVAYLAYVGSTGLSTMDYRLSDPSLDPPGIDESIYGEQTVRLPGTYWCYQPTELETLPAVGDRQEKTIRFGCLNNFCKVNAPLVDLWAEILQRVPDSRLLIHAYEGKHRQRLLERFAQRGVAAARIEFVGRLPRAKYFAAYQSLDITLDTTPYGGGTTTCDSLWMGVPVVTLAGKRAVGRGGVSLLRNIGLPELIAQTPEEYVRIAVELAHDLPRLRNLQATLRERMRASPLMDAPKYARNIETVYRQMWRSWCESRI